MAFEYIPSGVDVTEMCWRFSIKSQSVSMSFLLVGHTSEPAVTLDRAYLNFKSLLKGKNPAMSSHSTPHCFLYSYFMYTYSKVLYVGLYYLVYSYLYMCTICTYFRLVSSSKISLCFFVSTHVMYCVCSIETYIHTYVRMYVLCVIEQVSYVRTSQLQEGSSPKLLGCVCTVMRVHVFSLKGLKLKRQSTS